MNSTVRTMATQDNPLTSGDSAAGPFLVRNDTYRTRQ